MGHGHHLGDGLAQAEQLDWVGELFHHSCRLGRVAPAHRRDGQGVIIPPPGSVHGASCIDADEHREQGKGHATGGSDGDEATMVGGGDDGGGRSQNCGHSMGHGHRWASRCHECLYESCSRFALISCYPITPVLSPRADCRRHMEHERDS